VRSKALEQTAAQLESATKRITELEGEVARLQGRDPLVASLLTLSAFRAQLEMDVQRSQRYGRALTVVLVDIDGFKALNAELGYAGGDLILAAVGTRLAAGTRVHDLACRTGADEFALLLPETPIDGARVVVDRLLIDLEKLEAGGRRGISVSAGMAGLKRGQGADALLAEAATALDAARTDGGGRLVVVSDGGPKVGVEAPAGSGSAEVVAALAQALEERDSYTGEHSESVVDLTARVAEALGLKADEVQLIRQAALLHDIGKVGIPDEILHKPGPLTDEEWEVMRQHPAIGERILRAIPGQGALARIVRHEHERWDGRGYPDGIAGTEIPMGSRIILACDAYHAMVSDRPYRKAMPHQAAMAELTANAGTQFDPQVVEALIGYLYGRRQSGLATV
jgi:diguanylate cyclase (GGDEF)-like protein/putative nucleotidyltransferase with HDIG domain